MPPRSAFHQQAPALPLPLCLGRVLGRLNLVSPLAAAAANYRMAHSRVNSSNIMEESSRTLCARLNTCVISAAGQKIETVC